MAQGEEETVGLFDLLPQEPLTIHLCLALVSIRNLILRWNRTYLLHSLQWNSPMMQGLTHLHNVLAPLIPCNKHQSANISLPKLLLMIFMSLLCTHYFHSPRHLCIPDPSWTRRSSVWLHHGQADYLVVVQSVQ